MCVNIVFFMKLQLSYFVHLSLYYVMFVTEIV